MALNVEGGIKVIYDESIQKPLVPYEVSVDQQRATQLFLQNGVPADTVAQTRLLLTESPPGYFGQVGGGFNPNKLAINLYTDILFDKLNKKKPDSLPNKVFLHESKHLINYIQKPDYERRVHKIFDKAQDITLAVGGVALFVALGIGLACNLIPKRNEQGLTDFTMQMIQGGAAWMFFHQSLYYFNPIEISARRFARRYNKMPEWQSIVTIAPKPT